MSYLDGHLTLAEQKAYLDKVREAFEALEDQGWDVDWDAVNGHEALLVGDDGAEHYVCGYNANVDIIDDQGAIVSLSWEWDKDEWVYQPRGSERYRLLDAHEPADVAAAAEAVRHLPDGRAPLTWAAAFADYRIGEVQNRLVEELEGEVLGRGLHPDELTYIEYLPEECPAALCRAPDRNGTVVVAVVHGPEGGEPCLWGSSPLSSPRSARSC